MVINDNDDDDDVDDDDSDFCWFFIVYSETCPEELKAFSWLYNMTLFCWLIFFCLLSNCTYSLKLLPGLNLKFAHLDCGETTVCGVDANEVCDNELRRQI